MARVTVEDCIVHVPNRFELVMSAAQRAREVSAGAGLEVPRDNDKNPVVALREIADSRVSVDRLRESIIQGQRRTVGEEEGEEEEGVEYLLGDTESPVGEAEAEPASSETSGEGEAPAAEAVAEGEEAPAEADADEEIAEDVLSVQEEGPEGEV